ncbi:class I SAM-dependent methyltransferase [Leptospira sp. GIMC2001]|uniref:class I SAM-dependent methyltransferase n=1 Tax=Leptospira sp. GIMC2001 TaxID=1513297 RepID=UPI002349A6E1|nr:class I SAM-dependent methyltransferase [Leptospira sp. GIMC2001]WCL48353.1 class I SAM-dependent methyltransferase [Leptospira sp. GIMC2001]
MKLLFSKSSKDGELHSIYECSDCKTVQVNPIPSQESLNAYYSNEYFTTRTDRGYDNYYSDDTRKELFRVWNLNLSDLKVDLNQFIMQSSGNLQKPKSLDIGCAAGFFVDFMRNQGFQSYGIEIADEPVRYGRENLGLEIFQEDFLEWDSLGSQKFDLITMWASIEHMREPIKILSKIKLHLKEDGIVVISTCRWGIISRFLKQDWRFLNVPEHLFYFGRTNFIKAMESIGFSYHSSVTYGSGFTTRKNASMLYRIAKKIFDYLVKITNQGDMMAISFKGRA